MSKESFLLYKSYFELIEDFSDSQLANLMKMIFEFQIKGESKILPIDLEVKLAFKVIRNQFRLDNDKYDQMSRMRSEFGRLGGVAKASKSQLEPALLGKAAVYDNVYDKENDKDIFKGEVAKKSNIPPYKIFVEKLNQLKGRNFSDKDQKGARQFKYLMKIGYSLEDCETVIFNAYADRYHIENGFKYLTPEFLTRMDKFERYLGMKKAKTERPILTEEQKAALIDNF